MSNNQEDIYKYQPLWENWYIDMPIGKGSFGSVYKISREDMGHKYTSAVKIISIPSDEQYKEAEASFGGDEASLSGYFEDIVHNIVNEINMLYTLSGNINVVNYQDHKVIKKEDRIGWDVLIRMEYVTALKKYIASHPMTKREIIQLGIDICTALQLCSKKGIIHRDIKDDNIFVNQDGTFKLGDFGISRELSKSGRAASMRGTPLYMAPEIYRGEKYDAAVDIYSLGIVMYKLLNNGRMPFMPPYPQEIRYKDSEEALEKRMSGDPLPLPIAAGDKLGSVVLKACAFIVSERFGSAKAMKQELEKLYVEMTDENLDEAVTLAAVKSGSITADKQQDEATVSIFGTNPNKTSEEPSIENPLKEEDPIPASLAIDFSTELPQKDLNKTESIFRSQTEEPKLDKTESIFSSTGNQNPINNGTNIDESSVHQFFETQIIETNESDSFKSKKKIIIGIGITACLALIIVIPMLVELNSANNQILNPTSAPTATIAPTATTAPINISEVDFTSLNYNEAVTILQSLSTENIDIWNLLQPDWLQYGKVTVSKKIVCFARRDGLLVNDQTQTYGFMDLFYFNDNNELIYVLGVDQYDTNAHTYEIAKQLNYEIKSNGTDSSGYYDTIHVSINNVLIHISKPSYYIGIGYGGSKTELVSNLKNYGWEIINIDDSQYSSTSAYAISGLPAQYTISAGDLLSNIAKRYYNSTDAKYLDAIVAANVAKYPSFTRMNYQQGWVITIPVVS